MWSRDYLVISCLKGEPRSVGDFYAVLSFRVLYPHSLECILSVIWSISASLAFDPIFGAKARGGDLTSMQIWLWTDPILTFEDRYLIDLIGLLYYIFSVIECLIIICGNYFIIISDNCHVISLFGVI